MNILSQPPSPRALWLGCCLAALGAAACSGGGGSSSKNPSSNAGDVVDKPGGGFFYADKNQAGNAQQPRITRQAFGRLVEVFGLDAFGDRVPMASDFIVSPGLDSDGHSYLLETNPVTAQQLLVVLRDVTDTAKGGGRDQFFDKLYEAEQNLTPIHANDAIGSGVYSMVPRNSAVVVQFDDLIDESTLTAITFRVRTGNPPVVPFEGRVFIDENHGDIADFGGGPDFEFYSTRIVFDATVTEIESFQVDPPLPINGIGLPAAADVNLANFELRIPTKINLNVGQNILLRNPSGHAITSSSNGPVDFGSPTDDVVRAARSGGSIDVTADPFNGFLPDDEPPLVVGRQSVTIIEAPVPIGEGEFVLPTVVFSSEFCSKTPRPGDVLTQPGIFASVVQSPAPVQAGTVNDLVVRLLLYPSAWDEGGLGGALEWVTTGAGDAQFLSAFDSLKDLGRQACFARVLPTPSGFPENPSQGLATSSSMGLRFSEPMDPASLTAFDSLSLTRNPIPPADDPPLSTSDYVVGALGQSLDLQEFTFAPDLPLAHEVGGTESYFLTLNDQGVPPTDLAGNPLVELLPAIEFEVDPSAAPQLTGGRVSRFTGQDEEPPIGTPETGPFPEWGGQHLYDLARQLIKPRPVVHFQIAADRSQPILQIMTPFALGVQTPLSSLGSKMQAMWRYVDFGFSLLDATSHNIDVEGLYWAPLGGAVVSDSFGAFEIQMAHSDFAPDEFIDPDSLFPAYPNSGFKEKFSNNYLTLQEDPPKIVHPRFKGYQVNPGDLTVQQATGTKLMPYPWNRENSPEEWQTWTWRNTDIRARGGVKSSGVDPDQLWVALGLSQPCNKVYRTDAVRSIGLAMLMEFRCYPDEGATGVNAFDISLAANSSSKPFFRAFSTGGINDSGNSVLVDPDLETTANGGFNPTSAPPGAPTYGRDNTFYIGAADFVVRVSRSHSIWFPASNPFMPTETFSKPGYVDPVVEPRPEDQPDGTRVVLAFRGAKKMNPQFDNCTGNEDNLEWLTNAQSLDTYGDHYDDKCLTPGGAPWCQNCGVEVCVVNHNPPQENTGINFKGGESWSEDINEIDGAKFYQVRVTFEADIFTGLVPELSALAVSWLETDL